MYSKADVESTLAIYKMHHNYEIEQKIEKLRIKISECDDIYIREKLVKQILRLKKKVM